MLIKVSLLNNDIILVAHCKYIQGGVQVLRHQRGGWVGVAKWWRDQKINKEKKEPGSDTMPIISVKTYLKSIYSFEDITDQFNSSDWFFF